MVPDRETLLFDLLNEGRKHYVSMLVSLDLLLLEDSFRLWVVFKFESHIDAAYRTARLLNWFWKLSL